MRIEVGYGLEGTLTDAVSKLIIENAILPRFRANDFAGGIARGVDDIIQVLTGDAEEWKRRAAQRPRESIRRWSAAWSCGLLFAAILIIIWIVTTYHQPPLASNSMGVGVAPTGRARPARVWSSGSGSGGFSDGGFSVGAFRAAAAVRWRRRVGELVRS